jgi:nitrogenase molybdenum-cofactor synthesis protein NifE
MLINKTRVKIKNFKTPDDFPFSPLEATGPNVSGWGVVETTLLLPNSVSLMVGPKTCLRHSAFMAHARGFYENFYMLEIDENELIMESHFEKLEKTVEEIVKKRKPEILILAGTCCDYILGTDYSETIKKLENKFQIAVLYTVMAPLSIGSKPSPFELAYTALYDFLKEKKRKTQDDLVNVLGTFIPFDESGELCEALKSNGLQCMEIPKTENIRELSLMSDAKFSITVHPLGNVLASKLEKNLGIRNVFAPISYSLEEIEKNYEKIEKNLNLSFNLENKRKEAQKYSQAVSNLVKNKKIVIGTSVYGSAFELALALSKMGAEIKAIFVRNAPKPFEWEYIKKLRKIDPDVFVYNLSHPYLYENYEFFSDIEIAYGVDAGIFCKNAVNVPLSRYQLNSYGYSNLKKLFEETEKNLNNPIDNYEWIYEKNLLI